MGAATGGQGETAALVGAPRVVALVVDEAPVAPDHDLDDEERWWDGLDAPPARLVAGAIGGWAAVRAWECARAPSQHSSNGCP